MKRQIRRGVYETNSSSTHAICITNNSSYELPTHIDFRFGEFGWEFAEYDDVNTKASYLITAIFSFDIEDADNYLNQLTDILDSNHITYTMPDKKIDSWKYGGETHYYYDIGGYIDHAGETREFVEAVLTDSDKLFRYLFGKSMIITGNDNGDAFSYRMYITAETIFGDEYTEQLKPEFDNYEVYEKGN